MFCMKCGAQVEPEDNFCEKCGFDLRHPEKLKEESSASEPEVAEPAKPEVEPVNATLAVEPAKPAPAPEPAKPTFAIEEQVQETATPAASAASSTDGDTVSYGGAQLRFRCPGCGNVFNGTENQPHCARCKKSIDLKGKGVLALYRTNTMTGGFSGVNGTGIYIDRSPHGYVALNQRVNVILPMGEHRLHCTSSGAKKSNDIYFTLSEDHPIAYATVTVSFGLIDKTTLANASVSDMPGTNGIPMYDQQ